jgi:tetratricopeptide (TPR) repeat protein
VALLNLLLLPSLFYGLQSDDTDTFYHLAAGRHMAEHGGVLDREVSSFTIPGRPWTNYSWLFQRLLHSAQGVAGLAGVLAVRSSFLVLLVNVLFVLVWRRSGARPLPALALGLMGMGLVSLRALQVRPHLASYVCLAALLLVLDRPARPWRSAVAAFALCAAWANLHGIGYPVGLAAVGVYALASLAKVRSPAEALAAPEPRRLLLVLAASGAGFLANPFGWRLALAPLVATDAEAMSQIGEMARLPLAAFAQVALNFELRSTALANVAVLGGLALVPTWLRGSAWRALGSFALGAALLLFRGRRMVPEMAILCLPAIAEGLAIRFAAGKATGSRRGLQVLAGYLVLAAVVTTWRDARSGLFEPLSDRLPHGPVALLQRLDFQGHVLADPTQSGFVSWRLPRARIFMDMRMPEPFSSQEVWLYKAIGDGVSVDSVRDRFGLDAVLVRLASPLARRLQAQPEDGFGLAYADHAWTLFLPEPILAQRPELRVAFLPDLERIADGGAPDATLDREKLAGEVDRLVEVWPGNHLAQRTWLWLRTTGGQAPEAARQARSLSRLHPRVSAYPYCEGLAWSLAGDAESAARAFEQALRVEPGFEPAYPALARTLAALGRTGPALAVLEDFHERRRYRLNAADLTLLGSLRRAEARLAQAADAYERALWLTPEGAPERVAIEMELATQCLELGRWQRALELADAVLARQPGLPAAEMVRTRALVGVGRSAAGDLPRQRD